MDEGDADGGGRERRGREHVCEACGESFESEEALERHLYAVGMVD